MFSWLLGYKQDDDIDENEIPPPPKLVREQGYYKECNKDDIIKWKDYDKAIEEIREEIKKLKIDSDEKWNNRLSPVLETRSIRKKKKRKNCSFDNIKK
jgi:predicted AlkP superfamily phosphohydrolase/phosphomutase